MRNDSHWMSATAITISNVLRVQSRTRVSRRSRHKPGLATNGIYSVNLVSPLQLHRLRTPNAIDIAIASTGPSFFPSFPSFLSLFLFLLFLLLLLLHHFSSLLRFYHPLRNVVRVRVPRSHLVAVHGFSWRVSAFIIYPHTHSNYHRAYRPCQIFLRSIENDSACIIQRALSMPRSSTFYPCTHTERYDRFIIYARCQSWPVALNVLIC